jgi:hypothetical protein
VLFRSNKQKINTRSSTKSELIAVDDALPSIQWARNGYDLETHVKEEKTKYAFINEEWIALFWKENETF